MEKPPVKITLLGREHAVLLPSFVEREDIAMAYTAAQNAAETNVTVHYRAYSAAIGLCTRIGRMLVERKGHKPVTMASCGHDALAYGGEVYGWLREQGADVDEIAKAGAVIQNIVIEALYPRAEDVRGKKDFIEAGEGSTT